MSNKVDQDIEYIFRTVHLGDAQEFLDILNRNPEFNINIQNRQGESLLIHCVKRLDTKWNALFGGEFRAICKILINRDIDVNLPDASSKTAANYAAELKQLDILRLLIQKGADIDDAILDNVIDKEDWILTICASFPTKSDSEHVNGEGSEKVCEGDKVKLKLFHRLLQSDYFSSIRWMCELFPEIIEKKNEESLTALHTAVLENNVYALKILLEFKPNLEAVDNTGHTALQFAVDRGGIQCVLTLLESGAAVNCQDDSGASPLHYAIDAGFGEDTETSDLMIKHLLKYGADTTLADKNGRLPLHWAANAGNSNVCALMVTNGCPVNSRCNNGYTALHIAAIHGHAECIRVLVTECGASVNIKDKDGHTSLFNAIRHRHVHCAELLLYEDASPNQCNNQGDSPAHLAASKGLTEALEVLVQYKGSLELRNNAGDLPIHEAAIFQQEDAVNYMLRCQCAVNVRNNQGFTPLHLAASVGAIVVCQSLLIGGAHMNCVNTQRKNGRYKFLTPLDVAELNNHSDCVGFLKANGSSRGSQIVKFACRKIQRWWRINRPCKTILESIKECSHSLEETKTTNPKRSAPKVPTICLAGNTENIRKKRVSEHGNSNLLKQIERSSQTNPAIMKSTGNTATDGIKTNAKKLVKTRSARDTKQSKEMPNDLHKSKAKTCPTNKATSEKHLATKGFSQQHSRPIQGGRHSLTTKAPGYEQTPTSTSRKKSGEREDTQTNSKVTLKQQKSPQQTGNKPKSNLVLRQQEEERKDRITDTASTSKLETPQTIDDFKRLFDKEILRKENLSKEITRLRESLESRSQNLEKRLEAIHKNLEKI